MRSLSTAMQAASVAPVVYPLMMTRIDFDSGTLAWITGYQDVVFNGVVYEATGDIGSISPVKETPGAKPSNVSITISGLKPEVVALLQTEPYLNRKCWIHMAATDENWTFDADQVALYFYGKLDDINGITGETASFSISIRSRLADWERVRNLKYTDADQQKLYPGDKGMEFIAQLSQRKFIWPRAAFLPDPRD
jgi:hypothetical protein